MQKEYTLVIECEGEVSMADLIKPIVDAVQDKVGNPPTVTIIPKKREKIKIQNLTSQLPKSNYTIHIKR